MKSYSEYEAYAVSKDTEITVSYQCEAGWIINVIKKDGSFDFDNTFTACETVKRFKELAKQNGIEKVHVRPTYLDPECLAAWDCKKAEWSRYDSRAEACMLNPA